MASNVWKSSTGRYTFDSAPEPISKTTSRPKYRQPEEIKSDELEKTQLATMSNIMFDPRVVRGITLGQPHVAARASISNLRTEKIRDELAVQKRHNFVFSSSFIIF